MKTQKGFAPILIAIIIGVILLAGGGTYYYSKQNKSPDFTNLMKGLSAKTPKLESDSEKLTLPVTTVKTDISFSISGNTLSVIKNLKTIQTLSLDTEAVAALKTENVYINQKAFITDQDVNFDGNNDIAVLTGVGYSGVNIVYDYYIYNPKTEKFEKNSILNQISNPKIDAVNKTITSSYRSGPQWYSDVYKWNGTTFVKASGNTNSDQGTADWKTYKNEKYAFGVEYKGVAPTVNNSEPYFYSVNFSNNSFILTTQNSGQIKPYLDGQNYGGEVPELRKKTEINERGLKGIRWDYVLVGDAGSGSKKRTEWVVVRGCNLDTIYVISNQELFDKFYLLDSANNKSGSVDFNICNF